MKTKLKKGIGPGTWRRMGLRVFVTCPECGVTAQLDHKVDDQGNVTPSLDCPNDVCSWHVYAVLGGWTKPEVPHDRR